MIEKYLHYNILTGFHNTCRDYIEETARSWELQGEKDKLKEWEGNIHNYMNALLYGPSRLKPSQQKYYRFFYSYMGDWLPQFLFDKYRTTDAYKIYQSTENSRVIVDDFNNWFEKKREAFRMKTDLAIQQATGGKVATGKPAPSHGGIANLLRVLTRNMEARHLPLIDIAKVQYTVCCQAGVYLPEEFMEDVMILADDMAGDGK